MIDLNGQIAIDAAYWIAKIALVISAVVFFVSGLDELCYDLFYLLRRTYRNIFVYRRHKRLQEKDLLAKEEQPIAIFVAAWQEANVIGKMLTNTVRSLDYREYRIFVGVYPNDFGTIQKVDEVCRQYSHVIKVVGPSDGPTSKANNLNAIFKGMREYERKQGMRFGVIVLHDCEDIVHPLSLKMFNHLMPGASMVQLPVYPLETPLSMFTSGTYIDEFAESHTKDLIVREQLDKSIPAAGVGCAFQRDALEAVAHDGLDRVFSELSLTEDYELGIRMRHLPGKKIFVKQKIERLIQQADGGTKVVREIIATREFFPSDFWSSVKQRSRWILGISIQGWQSFGWRGSLLTRLMFYRDRKVLVTSNVIILGYIPFLYFLSSGISAQLSGSSVLPPLVHQGSWLYYLMFGVLLIMVNRLAMRITAVSRIYGLAHGLLAIPRVFWCNAIHFFATFRAIKTFVQSVARGIKPVWEKTTHEYPTEDRLQLYRRKLGDLLLETEAISLEQLHEALDHQKESHEPLGEILVRRGILSEDALKLALSKQDHSAADANQCHLSAS